MKLDQNAREDKRPKYSLLEMRRLDKLKPAKLKSATKAIEKLKQLGLLNDNSQPDEAFFVLKLKDRFAPQSLFGYVKAIEAFVTDPELDLGDATVRQGVNELVEFCKEVQQLVKTAKAHPKSKLPD